jgi:hypothetical protein
VAQRIDDQRIDLVGIDRRDGNHGEWMLPVLMARLAKESPLSAIFAPRRAGDARI